MGFVAKIDVAQRRRDERICTVTGASPVVDVTAASTTTTFQREALSAADHAIRSFAWTQQAPGLRTSAGSFDVGKAAVYEWAVIQQFRRTGDNWNCLTAW